MLNSKGEYTNTLFTNDNLYILNGLNSNSVDLIYLDPPFNSKRTYSAPIGSKSAGTSFKDIWTWDDVDTAYVAKLDHQCPPLFKFIESILAINGKAMASYITYMAQRIIELHRVLKATGSIYLHCDHAASHYLKMTMDAIFGCNNFKNEIIWKRTTSHNDAKKWGAIHDTILYYSKQPKKSYWNRVYTAYSEEYKKKFYKFTDESGRGVFWKADLSFPGGNGYIYNYKGHKPPKGGWRCPESTMKKWDAEGRIWFPDSKDKQPCFKRYLEDMKGKPIQDIITDINLVSKKESTGYPTQKPLALLHRIIKASSREGDIVLDPFCGCATTCVVAQELQRKWIGIDIEEKAMEILMARLKESESGNNDMFYNPVCRKDIPQRTDVTIEEPHKSIKEKLYKKQDGLCNGCKTKFELRNFEVDHIVPKVHGGGDYYDNYQLLCGHCNKTKGDRPMEFLDMIIEEREKSARKITFAT